MGESFFDRNDALSFSFVKLDRDLRKRKKVVSTRQDAREMEELYAILAQ